MGITKDRTTLERSRQSLSSQLPFLSVIIPAYNAATTLAEQLEALKGQVYEGEWELIVVDNGSTDNTADLVREYQQQMPHVSLICAMERKGAAYARNVGVSVAKGDWLVFVDADDEVAPGWLAAMARALCKCDFVAGRLEGEKLNGPEMLKMRQCPQQDGLQKYKYPPYLPHAAGTSLGVKRSLHEAIGGFNESMLLLHDTDYCWRIQLTGTELHFVPEALIHYRLRDSLAGMYRQAYLWGEYNVVLYKKYRPLGMPRLSWKRGVKAWIKLAWRLPELFHPIKRGRWLRNFAWRAGRLRGCIKYQVLAF